MKSIYIPIISVALCFSNAALAQNTFDERETAAVSTVTWDDLEKNSSPNPYNTFYGLIPGLSVMQQVGWDNNSTLIMRGSTAPLIVVDGYPRPLESLSTVEIESISILKDGAATALWGTRGANGVVLVKTKRGDYNSRNISVNYSHGMGLATNRPKMADGYGYAAAYNEALYYDGLPLQYTQSQLDAFRSGAYPDLFANADWQKEALRNHTVNNQLDITFQGGSKTIRYFTSLNYKNDFGILNPKYSKNERYDSQYRKYDLSLRMNIDIDLTPLTLVKWTMLGSLQERTRPSEWESTIFPLIYKTPAAAYPVKTSGGHWGGGLIHTKNPVATFSDAGYFKANPRTLQADLRIIQDLSPVTPGLSAEVAVAYDNYAVYKEQGDKTYSYEVNIPFENVVTGGDYESNSAIYGTDGALNINCWGMTEQYIQANVEGKVNYDRTFGRHGINAGGIYRMEYYSPLGRNNTVKRMYFTGTAGYNFAGKYLADVTVSRTGTSKLQSGGKFNTYPAVSAAWLVSKEAFMENATAVNFLKLRASWGQSGNDAIDYDLTKQYYTGTNEYYFGEGNMTNWGVKEGTSAITNLKLERVNKYNAGVDMQLFNKLTFSADAYLHQYRDVLIGAGNFFSSVYGNSVPMQNMGKYDRKGFELSAVWKDQVNKDFSYYAGLTVSHTKTKVVENGEGYKEYDYMSAKGLPIGQIFGLEAIGYFNDPDDIANSPVQQFSAVRLGDIKYKDQNGDGVIDSRDVVAIGHSGSIPEWYGGLQLGFEYKGFGMDVLFQGATGLSRQLTTSDVYRPLRDNGNVSRWYLEDKVRWTEETRDIANMPRLSTLDNANNYQTSTQWLVNGRYLKLRNLNIYYNLPKKWLTPLRMENCKVYLRGNDLFSLDHVPYLNCEHMSVNYPDLASVHAGVTIKF